MLHSHEEEYGRTPWVLVWWVVPGAEGYSIIALGVCSSEDRCCCSTISPARWHIALDVVGGGGFQRSRIYSTPRQRLNRYILDIFK